jgi:hypothetical protein
VSSIERSKAYYPDEIIDVVPIGRFQHIYSLNIFDEVSLIDVEGLASFTR